MRGFSNLLVLSFLKFFQLSKDPCQTPRPVRESSCPTWSFLPVAWFLPDWRFPFLRLRLRSSSPWPPFILSLGRDVSGSAEPALVLYALGKEHLPRCQVSSQFIPSTGLPYFSKLLLCLRVPNRMRSLHLPTFRLSSPRFGLQSSVLLLKLLFQAY